MHAPAVLMSNTGRRPMWSERRPHHGAKRNCINEYEARSGMLLVADPGTGELLAIAATPGFDPNDITAVISDTENEGRNPAVSEQFKPGSVLKILTMAAALESGVFSRNSTYYDTGKFEYGGIVIQNWDYKRRRNTC